MTKQIILNFQVLPGDFSRAGEASSTVKNKLKQLGIHPDIIRKVAISLYEGEINMVIHSDGGEIRVIIDSEKIEMILKDQGKGIPDISKAMQEGFSTASENARSMGFGAGMGLPNMKKHSDKMNILSTVGRGTKITLWIYLNQGE